MFSELKTLIKHSSVYMGAEFLRKGIGFIMIPLYTRYLSPANYGLLELIDITLNVIGMIVGLRIGSALIRYYHHFEETKDKQEVFTTAFIITFILSISVLIFLEIFSIPISALILGNSQYFSYFQVAFICLAIQTIYLVPETYLIALKKSVLYSSLSIGTLISNLSLNIFFLVFLKMGVMGILLSMLITKIINGLIVTATTLRNVKLAFSFEKLKKMVNFSLPLVPAGIAMFTMHFSDRFFVQKYCSLNDLGLYSLGYKFGMILSVLISAPIFRIWDTQRFEIAKSDDAKQVFKKIFTYFSAILIFVGLIISIFIDELIYIIASSEYHGASSIVPLIVLSYVLFGISNFFTLGMVITSKTKHIAFVQVIAAAINILLNFLLISRYGIIGAAISTLLSFLFLAVFNFIVSQKLYHITCEYRRVLILFVLAGVTFGLSRLIKAPLMISFGVKSVLLVCFPLILVLGKFFYEEEIIKSKELLKSIASRFSIAKA